MAPSRWLGDAVKTLLLAKNTAAVTCDDPFNGTDLHLRLHHKERGAKDTCLAARLAERDL
jgi:hypothetical protein